MVRSSIRRYRYAVDARDTIVSVSPEWLAFARENGAPELTEQAVTGRSLWHFIDGTATVRLYQAILQRVRSTAEPTVLPFRCDSPTLRRYMRLEINSQPDAGIRFDGWLERVEPCTRLNLLDVQFARGENVLTLCSMCKRALVEPAGWLELEDAAARLHLFEEKQVPQLRQTVCPRCNAAAGVSV